ncbi:hypothetical protein [Methylobacterium brachythecii]|uniref:Uncharacterized protein n=1 Tax=Methylobacterium brachythecii TaxID=1176177 RepID=A0A7W6AIF5_9HYPH|nr:hypothetical protein [Methylobacterium brachythecii]MBB3901980.1 hypothetical protein [Methylobacterium brachythecii]GLS43362.1 hypothetical protein GCM10007884_13470 [Methylobacterium brachythecii]
MTPSQSRLATDAYKAAWDIASKTYDSFANTPDYIVKNHIMIEIVCRMRQGVKSRRELINCGVRVASTASGQTT